MKRCSERLVQVMTIEQAQHLRVVWESKGLADCQHPAAEYESYPSGERTGMLVCSRCGDYLGGNSENLAETSDVL